MVNNIFYINDLILFYLSLYLVHCLTKNGPKIRNNYHVENQN